MDSSDHLFHPFSKGFPVGLAHPSHDSLGAVDFEMQQSPKEVNGLGSIWDAHGLIDTEPKIDDGLWGQAKIGPELLDRLI
jgi:hypothetical protein